MLFLHGYGSCKESFFYQIQNYSTQFCVTALDFIGFGKSSPLQSAWGVQDYASFLHAFVQTAGVQKPIVVAHSFGARVAFCYASAHPVKALVITGGAGVVKPRSAAYRRRVTAYRTVRRIAPRFAESHFGSQEYRALSPVMKQSYKKIVNTDVRPYCQKIAVPTLLVYGQDDVVTPYREEGKLFGEALKNATLVSMPGSHFCFAEHPQIFHTLVDQFLKDLL